MLAQNIVETRTKVRAYYQAHEHKIVGELIDLLSIPNLASDSINILKNAGKLVAMLEQRSATACRSVFLPIFLKTPTIGVPIVNHDNNQHSVNENLRLQNFLRRY